MNRRTFCLSSVAAAVTPAVVKTEPEVAQSVEDTSCADEMLRYIYEEGGSTVYLQDLFGCSCHISLHWTDPENIAYRNTPTYTNYRPICLDAIPFVMRDGRLVNDKEICFPESAGLYRNSGVNWFAISDTRGNILLKGELDYQLMPLSGVTPIFSKGSIRLVHIS